ncbi:MAG TPA: SelB C-terminal domain-containing protein, partial [Ktedonobacterales bacterium]|nr:SelB C-terminal domain-containing protein [Ktedonobacterales bacterium]
VVARGDRFIVRIPSPSLTVGGGSVIEPRARRHRKREAAVLARLNTLAQGDPEEVVLAALRPEGTAGAKAGKAGAYGGHEPGALVAAVGLPADDVHAAIAALSARGMVVRVGALVYAASEWDRLRADAARWPGEYHRQYPLRSGMPREEWRSRLGLSMRDAGDALAVLAEASVLAEVGAGPGGRGAFVRLDGFEPRMTSEQELAVAALLERFERDPFSPPDRADVEAAVGPEVLASLIERGTLLKVSDVILLTRAAYDEAVRRITGYLRTHDTITVADARDLLGTTRKYMLAIFEHLDQQRITRRAGDDRVLGPNTPAATA